MPRARYEALSGRRDQSSADIRCIRSGSPLAVEREAQLLASLNHPNVAGVYGLEESGGVNGWDCLVRATVGMPNATKSLAVGSPVTPTIQLRDFPAL